MVVLLYLCCNFLDEPEREVEVLKTRCSSFSKGGGGGGGLQYRAYNKVREANLYFFIM